MIMDTDVATITAIAGVLAVIISMLVLGEPEYPG